MKTIKDLKEFGFIKAGHWFLSNNGRIDFKLEKQFELAEDILYSFESENSIRYIGITEQTLKSRMINYKSGHKENKSSGYTNTFVNAKIKELLIKGQIVNIYFFKGEAECTFLGLRISLSTGIEKSLIKLFDFNENLWNSRGVKNTNKNLKDKIIESAIKENELSNNQTIIKLGKESFDKGFILFKNDVDNLLPLDSEGMDIIYNGKVINGWFTRSFKNKKVNGHSELKDIINNNFVFGEKILVTIISSNEIKIEKTSNA